MRVFLSLILLCVAILSGYQHVINQDPGMTGSPELITLDASSNFDYFDNSLEKGLISTVSAFESIKSSFFIPELLILFNLSLISFLYAIRASPRFVSF